MELIRQPIFLLLMSASALFIAFLSSISYFGFGDEPKLVKDSVLAVMLLTGLLASVLSASNSLAREIRTGTALAVLSKPVGRAQFFLAKYVGLSAVLVVMLYVNLVAALLASRMAFDAYGSADLLGLGIFAASLAIGYLMGAFSTFSFHGTKTVTTGEGGLFATNDTALFDHVLTLSNHGRTRGQTKQFWPDMVGYKYKMSNLQAAIGCAQLERIDELIAGKRHVFDRYAAELAGLPLRMNPEPEGTRNGYWMPTIVIDEDVPFDRTALLEEFRANEIDGRVFFWPLSMLPMFEQVPENRVSYSLFARAVNLPTYHDLTDEEIARVAAIVRRRIQRMAA